MLSRRRFIGGSDARIIMGDDEGVLLRLWREKRGEVEPEDLSGNLIVQLGLATEDLNRRWYEAITGQMPAGLYILVVCYATAVIFLGWLPWAGEARGSRTSGSFGQSHCPARARHRGPKPPLVRGQYRPGHYRYPKASPAPGAAVDGGHPRRACPG